LASGPGARLASAAPVVVMTVATGGNPIGVASDPTLRHIYVANGQSLTVLDADTLAILASRPAGYFPFAVAVDSQTHQVYVTNGFASGYTVTVFDGTTYTLLATITLSGNNNDLLGIALDPATRRGFVTSYNGDSVTVLNLDTNALVTTVAVPALPLNATVDPQTHRVYVTNVTNQITILDGDPASPTANQVVGSITAGAGTYSLALDPATRQFYATDYLNGAVLVLDADTYALLATIPTDVGPRSVAVDTAARRVYVTHYLTGGPVTVLDADTHTVVTTLPTGDQPEGVAVDPTTHRAFVANSNSGSVTVVGDQAGVLDRTSLAFGDQRVGTTSAAQTITLSNTGDEPVTVSGLPITGTNAGDFAISAETCIAAPVPAHQTCAIDVTFTPVALGLRASTLTVQSDVPGGLPPVQLSGPGVAPAVTLDPGSLAFAPLPVGATSAPQTVTLTNSGSAPLALTGITASGDFAQTSNCGATLAARASCTITVTFTPTAPGVRSGTLTLTDDAAGGPHTVALSGTGIPLVALTVQTSGPGQVTPGSGPFPAGTTVTLTASPAADATLLGWTVDGTFRGWPPTLTLTLDQPHTVAATFATLPTFSDVSPGDPAASAIRQLAARGVINGYAPTTCQALGLAAPCYGPHDFVVRAQMAALIVRAFGWDTASPSGAHPFSDLGPVDPELQRALTILTDKGILRGYGDGTVRPLADVLHLQVISFITRSMEVAGRWQAVTTDDGSYANVPASSGARADLLTFVHYAGALPDRPTGQPWADWNTPASRAWTAQLLWQALDSYFGR
jgi:YVTN family beta-propeller protein